MEKIVRFFYFSWEIPIKNNVKLLSIALMAFLLIFTTRANAVDAVEYLDNPTVVLENDAEQNTVSGTVSNASGETMPGVTVLIKGTAKGTTTDIDGNFTLTGVNPEDILVFSFIGLKTQEISVLNNTVFNVVMYEDRLALDEVIVIGYGTAKRQEYTGSVSSVKMENSPVALLPNFNALESLKGNVAGLSIGASNSAGDQPDMIIRGQNSISGSNDPLIVLDGVIFQGSLSDINPNDIATFDILKDAVSVAVYGSRSANGVIAITTKKGALGKPIITMNASFGVESWQNRPVMMKGEEWIEVVNARNQYAEGTTSWMKTGELANYNAGKETVWLDEVTQTGITQDYQVSFSGAAENVNYYLSAAYSDVKGIVVGDDFNRISVLGKVKPM